MRKTIDLAALLVLMAGAMFAVKAALRRPPEVSDRSESSTMPLSDFSPLLAGGHWLGPRDAPVVILAYSTYVCGFCGELQQSLAALTRRYPQHLAPVIKHYVEPVRGAELDMALASECAAEVGAFARYHVAAFANAAVVQHRDGWRTIADSAGIERGGVFDECVLSQEHVSVVESHFREGRDLGIVGTPTLFVNGVRVNGAAPVAVLDSLVAHALRRK